MAAVPYVPVSRRPAQEAPEQDSTDSHRMIYRTSMEDPTVDVTVEVGNETGVVRGDHQAQVQAAMQDQIRFEASACLGPGIILLQIIATAVAAYFLYIGQHMPCSEPLYLWCLVWLIRWNLSTFLWVGIEQLRNHVARRLNTGADLSEPYIVRLRKIDSALSFIRNVSLSFAFVWFVFGTYLMVHKRDCDSSLVYVCFTMWAISFLEFCTGPLLMCTLVCCMPCALALWICLLTVFRHRRQSANMRLGEEIMNRLPDKTWDEIRRNRLEEELDVSCPICSESLADGAHPIVELPCPGKHVYHRSCVLMWFRINQICPICRADLAQILNLRSEPGSVLPVGTP